MFGAETRGVRRQIERRVLLVERARQRVVRGDEGPTLGLDDVQIDAQRIDTTARYAAVTPARLARTLSPLDASAATARKRGRPKKASR